jgi:uncharacterized protein YceH (UPF0502 family)
MIELTTNEARVIGALIEKEITTPDQYPLSLNALVLACNQKSNRDPVLSLSLVEVQGTVDSLVKRRLVSDRGGYGGRVAKFKHRLCNLEFGGLQLDAQELGIICVMLLRGPQTAGDLRTRTQRLCAFDDAQAVEQTLEVLIARDDGPFVARLPRVAGARESRYAHLFSGAIESVPASAPAPNPVEVASTRAGLETRVTALEETVAALHAEIEILKMGSKE